MKTINKLKNILYFALCLFGLAVCAAVLVLAAGCATGKPHSDPLAGWRLIHSDQIHRAVTDDYHDYIESLPPRERHHARDYNIRFFENGAGEHAVKISIPLNGVWREHVLFYDRDDKRRNVMNYVSGRYIS